MQSLQEVDEIGPGARYGHALEAHFGGRRLPMLSDPVPPDIFCAPRHDGSIDTPFAQVGRILMVRNLGK